MPCPRTPLAVVLVPVLLFGACSSGPAAHAAGPGAASTVDVAPVAHPQGETPAWWYRSGAARAAANGAMAGRAKNVILFLGDGMSLTTVAAARILEGQRHGNPGEENLLSWERFPATAFSKTYNTDSQTPDSAGTMTAIATGVKTRMGVIGLSDTPRAECAPSRDKPLLTWLQLADSAGMATGVVTTTRLTHATPAAMYAKSPERNWEGDADLPPAAREAGCRDIAQQLLSTARFGRGPVVAFGGGRAQFTPAGQRDPQFDDKVGLRLDGRDLVGEWRQAHPRGAYVRTAAQLDAAADAPALLGLFDYDHMSFEHDRDTGPDGEPSLAQMTRAAVRTLARDPAGFVLMVEGGRIDHANHYGNAYRALDETIALSEAVRAALETAPPDTLVIVTADHSHVLNFAGYPVRGNPILGKVRGTGGEDGDRSQYARDLAGQTYTTLSYANGPGYPGASNAQPEGPKKFLREPSDIAAAHGRPNLDAVDTEAPDYLQESMVPMKAESHGGEDVGVWATGPGSTAIRGTLEQNTLYHVIVQATPKLRERLCAAGTCNADGVPVELPAIADFERGSAPADD